MIARELSSKIGALYTSGMNGPQVAKNLRIGETTVYRGLSHVGIKPSKLIAGRIRNRVAIFTPEQDIEISKIYTGEGVSLQGLAKIYSCCAGAIRNALKREHIKLHPKGNRYREFAQEEIENIKTRWNSGESQTAIARVYSSSQGVICGILRRESVRVEERRPRGAKHGSWKGGVAICNGYRYLRIPREHKFYSMAQRQGYVAEHRLVMADNLARPLRLTETVHHKNGNKSDNRIENLELRSGPHGTGVRCYCADCGSENMAFS